MAFSNKIIWCNYGQYKIIDIHDNEHARVQQCLLEYFRGHRLFQVLKIQQEPGIENDFLQIVKHILQNESSLMIVDSESNDIKGVALLMCMTKVWHSWTCLQLLIESERFKELCEMTRWCLQQEMIRVKDNPGADSLHIFSLFLCPELEEDKKFLAHFFNAICEVARHLHMPRVTAVSLDQNGHTKMKTAGFVELVRVVYSLFMWKNRRPFDRLRDINEMYGVFFEKKVQPLVPYQEMLVRHVSVPQAKEEEKIAKETKMEENPDDADLEQLEKA